MTSGANSASLDKSISSSVKKAGSSSNRKKFYEAGEKLGKVFAKGIGGQSDSIIKNVETLMTSLSVAFIPSMQTLTDIKKCGKDTLEAFRKGVAEKSSQVKEFYKKVMVNINKVITNTNTSIFKTSGKKSISEFIAGVTSKQSSAKSAINKILNIITTAIKGKYNTFTKYGSNIISKFSSGISSKNGSVKSAVSKVVSSAVTAISDKYTNFYNNGKYLGSGLVLGIEAKEDAVYDAAYKLGQKAVQGEKDGQKSNSPSKLTIQAGKWLGEGLVIGINKMERSVYKAGHNMGENAVDPISQAISNISKVINSDVDAQPTIRPVMDLSDVESGAKTINGLLGNGVSIGTYSNLRMINSMMNERAQNGSNNADVVNAINKLNKKLDNVGNTYNSINGVTYDDGSNIHNAIGEIVRAARIERRR